VNSWHFDRPTEPHSKPKQHLCEVKHTKIDFARPYTSAIWFSPAFEVSSPVPLAEEPAVSAAPTVGAPGWELAADVVVVWSLTPAALMTSPMLAIKQAQHAKKPLPVLMNGASKVKTPAPAAHSSARSPANHLAHFLQQSLACRGM